MHPWSCANLCILVLVGPGALGQQTAWIPFNQTATDQRGYAFAKENWGPHPLSSDWSARLDTGPLYADTQLTVWGNSRAYLVNDFNQNSWWGHTYTRLDLRGKTLSFTIDLSHVKCNWCAPPPALHNSRPPIHNIT